jgi:hypothetical protein
VASSNQTHFNEFVRWRFSGATVRRSRSRVMHCDGRQYLAQMLISRAGISASTKGLAQAG